ncbi:MAG TPA: ATPase, T2SS/T4P/T4SS family [Ruminococcus sp.]|nr:ATPase, T2SS/T4P/T4SS family [Ruminococcus sp.]
MKTQEAYTIISRYMTKTIRSAMLKLDGSAIRDLTEIRLYAGRKAVYIFPDRIRYLTCEGRLTGDPKDHCCINIAKDEIDNIMQALCHYSLYSCMRELHEGFIVLPGGVRVGISGRMSDTKDRILTEYSGLNFRISRCIPGISDELFARTGKGAGSVLICGGVNSGKTTLLRDLCRACGNIMKTVLIDERNEISSTYDGICSNEVGELTNVITGCDRTEGIILAIRTLSPDIIFCDEIAGEKDTNAILKGHGSGVRFAATIHADSYEDIFRRQALLPLINSGVFTHAAILQGSGSPSVIREIRRLGNASENCSSNIVYNSRNSFRCSSS